MDNKKKSIDIIDSINTNKNENIYVTPESDFNLKSATTLDSRITFYNENDEYYAIDSNEDDHYTLSKDELTNNIYQNYEKTSVEKNNNNNSINNFNKIKKENYYYQFNINENAIII
jgi:hypothetical protein